VDKCSICRKEVADDCDYNQGRCPHRKPMIEIQPKDTSKGHFYVSIIKSAIRVAAGVSLIEGNIVLAGALIVIAEAFGILEELV